jgi:hypothetical protein
MQLTDLVKPLEDFTDEELIERLRTIRNNRNTIRPAAQKHAKKKEKKGSQGRVSKVESLLEGLTPAQIKELLGG